MAYGIARFAQASTVPLPTRPSDSIWADCLAYQLTDESTGYFFQQDFFDTVTLPGLPNTFTPSTGAGWTQQSTFDHVATATSGTLTNAFIQTYSRPLGPITPGNKFWAEASLAVSDVSTAKGIFFGIGNTNAIVPANTGGTNGAVANASATLANNKLGPVAKSSLAGFWMHGDTLNNFDAVYLNQGTAVAPQTVTTVLQSSGTLNTVVVNALTSNNTTPNPGNPNYTPATPPGTLTVLGTGGQSQLNSGSAGFVKLGVRYDGFQYFYWYVNGIQVAKSLVDNTWDQTSDMGVVYCQTNGTAATAVITNLDFIRGSAQFSL